MNGVPVEIHARIMPSFWRLPEKEMLSRAMPLANFSSLSTLDAEGTMLHTLMHCAAHMFGFGLKTAWDISWILERHPQVDSERLRRWADSCSMPAGFYLPASVLRSVLDVAVPLELCGSYRGESRFAAIERVLRQRMFIAMEETADINPITKHGTYMLLHNSWTGRSRHLFSLFGKHERESRVAARKSSGAFGELGTQFRQSRQHLKRFRVALADARAEAKDERAFLFADA